MVVLDEFVLDCLIVRPLDDGSVGGGWCSNALGGGCGMFGNCALVLIMVICQLKIIQIIKNYITIGKKSFKPYKT